MRIGVDIMGGDFAPRLTTLGAIKAYEQLPSNVELVLFGKKEQILEIFKEVNFNPNNVKIHNTNEVIGMGEHPAKTFQQKPDSSIAVGFRELLAGNIDGFASAGSTGAMLVGAMHTIKSIPGVIRPTITAAFPKLDGGNLIVCDVGINVDCKPDILYQYAILGSLYAENVYGIKNPRVGLLNIGSEEEKGNLLTKSAHELMKGTKEFNFIGNVEGSDLFSKNDLDVVITDGFTGNVLLKFAESIYNVAQKRNINDAYLNRFNSESHGGSPVLGVNSVVMIGHGGSSEIAIKNMILHTQSMAESKIVQKIKESFK
ncbi:MAG TPA: phosphate--acyl-ACP acyltransferase [Bacteroidales bacterium]|nr:MAG: phosphate acyltransferase [Bacteroidetes bacterium GWF2_33_38]OFY86091.1 MAG: phosphate acyltransferase [Bacteroidetes bacterium RIFOXYA2_FULL_33_7]HBF87671.1 phosphate--acyl-ACP acyltransferase [Bacteroidales bacterium]